MSRVRPDVLALRTLAEQAFSRAAGAPLVGGNAIRLLRDAAQNYPAWIDAIESARSSVLFENYIVHDDATGRRFADVLAAKAREGVRVRVLYDWLGCRGTASRAFWDRLRAAGAQVRAFNPPRFDSPLGWVSRNHRKSLCVDDRVAFASGLCVGRMWVGDPQRGIAPWRDTGVELRGPAVADVAQAFARAWAETGVAIPADELPERAAIARCGDVGLRVLATMPAAAGLYRLDQMIAALARTTLWLTDAYFAGIATYIQALRQAALDGVDVRLLVPGASDVPILSPITRAGYRPLLEAGVRVFEWNGPMLHAKTAVADGRWSRVGSSNLNLASWLGNWELDVAVEDIGFASQMQQAYLADLEGATEIVLADRNRVRLAGPAAPSGGATHARKDGARRGRGLGGSAGQLAAGAARVGNTFGAAITNRRVLGTAEAKTMTIAAVVLIAVAAVAALWPQALAWPLAAFAVWSAIALLLRAARLHRKATEQLRAEQKPPD